jgi:hypothetical protein
MAFDDSVFYKSLDEITDIISDTYDDIIKPRKIWRNNRNKLYLIFRACAAGIKLILDAVLTVRYKFDPLYAAKSDLYSIAKLVGTDFKKGKGSLIRITIVNQDSTESKLFKAGIYEYTSSSGMVFSFENPGDYLFSPEEQRIVFAVSSIKGSYHVGDNAYISLVRTDGDSIDSSFIFSCEDNSGQLGYPDEDEAAFRDRILNDADRQDHIKELELKIRNLPGILECCLKLNESTEAVEYDGITLAPLELLVTLNGAPTGEIAELVARYTLYATHESDPNMVVYYENDLYVNGRYPVYYRYFTFVDFSLDITYQYDAEKLKSAQVEIEIAAVLSRFTHTAFYIDIISEIVLYDILREIKLPNLAIMNVDIVVGGEQVPYIRIPKTRLANLTGIMFHPIEGGSTV